MKKIMFIVDSKKAQAHFIERLDKNADEDKAAIESIMRRTVRADKMAVLAAVKKWASEQVEIEGLPIERLYAYKAEGDGLKVRMLPDNLKPHDLQTGEQTGTLETVAKVAGNEPLLIAARALRWVDQYSDLKDDWSFARVYSLYESITATDSENPKLAWPRPEKTTLHIDEDRKMVRIVAPGFDRKRTFNEIGLIDKRGSGSTKPNKTVDILKFLSAVDKLGGVLPSDATIGPMDISTLRKVLNNAFGWPKSCIQKEPKGWRPAFKVKTEV